MPLTYRASYAEHEIPVRRTAVIEAFFPSLPDLWNDPEPLRSPLCRFQGKRSFMIIKIRIFAVLPALLRGWRRSFCEVLSLLRGEGSLLASFWRDLPLSDRIICVFPPGYPLMRHNGLFQLFPRAAGRAFQSLKAAGLPGPAGFNELFAGVPTLPGRRAAEASPI